MTKFMKGMEKVWKILETTNEECPQCNEMTLRDSIINEKNSQWKGNKAGYIALHNWVRRRKLKPINCIRCNKRPAIDLANISGNYMRNIDDYEWLCRYCHTKSDGRLDRLNTEYKGRTVKKIKWICGFCKTEKLVFPSFRNKYCSKICFDNYQRQKFKGKHNERKM